MAMPTAVRVVRNGRWRSAFSARSQTIAGSGSGERATGDGSARSQRIDRASVDGDVDAAGVPEMHVDGSLEDEALARLGGRVHEPLALSARGALVRLEPAGLAHL